MRNLLYLLLIAGAAYLGWNYLQNRPLPFSPTEIETEPSVTVRQAPEFESKIQIPEGAAAQKALAPPGVYYMLERVSVSTADGVKAMVPGEEVRLVERPKPGRMKVTAEGTTFDVAETQVTNDLQRAQAAEKQTFMDRSRRP